MAESDYQKISREIRRERRAQEREQRKGLRGKALVSYIWMYYKFHIIITVVCVAAAASLLSAVLTPEKLDRPNALISINGGGDYTAWFDAFGESLGIDPETEQVTATTSYVYGSAGFDYASQTAVMVHFSAGEYDCIIGDDLMLGYTMQMGASYDLETFLPEDLKELVGDRFVYCAYVTTDSETGEATYGEEHAYAVDITDTKFVTECGITADRITFSIPETAENTDDALALLRYILAE